MKNITFLRLIAIIPALLLLVTGSLILASSVSSPGLAKGGRGEGVNVAKVGPRDDAPGIASKLIGKDALHLGRVTARLPPGEVL